MKKKWKACWARRPRLGRGGKTVRNLLLVLALAVLVWGQYGYPLPTAEMEFRRLERRNLLPRSEIVLALPEPKTRFNTADGTGLEVIDRLMVGLGTDWVAVGFPARAQGNWNTLQVFPLEDGPSLAPLWSSKLNVTGRGGDDLSFAMPLLVVRVPEEAAGGKLVLDAMYLERKIHRESPLWRLEEGLWLAAIANPEDTAYSSDWSAGAACTLTLYRADGSLLLEWSGTVPSPE